MERIRNHVLTVLLATLLSIVATGAIAQKVRIFTGSAAVFAPVFIADQQNYFRDEGLDVTVRTFTSGAEATESFRAGAADFLVAADVPLIYLLAGGDVAMLSQFSASPEMLYIIGPKGTKDPAALKGKKVGLVTKSASELLLNNYLKRGGLRLTDVERVHLAPFDQVPALVRGDVYALSSWKPFDVKILQLGGGRFEVLTYSVRENYTHYSGIVGKKTYVAAQPEVTTKVVKALVRAANWMKAADRKTRSETLAKYLKIDAADIDHVILTNRWEASISPDFLKTMTLAEQFLADEKLIKQRVNWSTAYDWSFLKKTYPKLVP
jgi:ABC-type nitrate/sulfonate/bicarbonate transport system substrate-binding protein